MSYHPSESRGFIHTKATAGVSVCRHPILLAIALASSALTGGCRRDAGLMSDPLVGRTAGEQRCFGLGHGVNLEFRWAPAGSFLMGSPADEPDRDPGEHPMTTRIQDGFWIAEVETTVSVWRKVMGREPPMRIKGDSLPVSSVSWFDCRDFLERLPSPRTGWSYELPTEAQWEYACRAGTPSPPAKNLADMGWIDANSGGRSHSVGKKTANAWWLHDMHGNVAEWCRDAVGPRGSERAIRGGSWDSDLGARAGARNSDTPYLKINRVGFRLVLVREPTPTPGSPVTPLANR